MGIPSKRTRNFGKVPKAALAGIIKNQEELLNFLAQNVLLLEGEDIMKVSLLPEK